MSTRLRQLKRTGAFRLVACADGIQSLPPLLQDEWLCEEDGVTEWRRVQTVYLTLPEYLLEADWDETHGR